MASTSAQAYGSPYTPVYGQFRLLRRLVRRHTNVYIFKLLPGLDLKIHRAKCYFLPILIGEHLGVIIDMQVSQFRAPKAKLKSIAVLRKGLLCISTSHTRYVNVKNLTSLAGKAQLLHLSITVAMFFLWELHDIVTYAKTWSTTVRVTPQLKRDLEWWKDVLSYQNGAPI